MTYQDSCADCRFWIEEEQGTQQVGQCRRYAPRPMLAAQDSAHVAVQTVASSLRWWPITKKHDWCGEYTARYPAR